MQGLLLWMKQRGWVFLLILSFVLVVHGAYLRYENERRESKWDVAFEYDEQLSVPLPESLQFSGGAKLTLAVFLPAGPVSTRVRYLGVVHRKHRANGLRVVGVIPGTHRTAEWYQESARLRFEVVEDEHLDAHMAFRVAPAHGHTAVALFDGEGRVKFHAFEIPEEDDMRQVVEKYLLGTVAYEYRIRKLAAVVPGQMLPLTSFRTLTGEAVDARNRILIFVPSGCPSCEISRYQERILELLPKLGGGQYRVKKVVLVFPDDPNTSEWIPLHQGASRFARELWVSQEPGVLWDDYYTRYAATETEPLILATDSRGVIEFTRNLEDVLAQWK